jgi:L-iditol 2-dehydrogenase
VKAAFLVGVNELEVREVPDPVAPDDGLVLQVQACGVCGSDLRRWNEGPLEPYVPGHEVGGIVVEVGSGVTRYRPGDHLAVAPDIHCGHCYYCQRALYNLCDDLHFLGVTPGYPGGFAQAMVLTGEALENGIVHRMPAGLSFVEGALAEPCSSVLAAHHKAGTSLDDTVVFRPDLVVDPLHQDLVEQVRCFTGGVGADIVICANPVAETQTQAVEMVRKGGRVILFGGLPRSDPLVALDANRIHYGEIEVVGAFSYHPTFHELALDVLRRKLVPADLLVTHRFPLDQVAKAFETAASGQGLKVVVTP